MQSKTAGWIVGILVYSVVFSVVFHLSGGDQWSPDTGTKYCTASAILGLAAGFATFRCLKSMEENREQQRRHQAGQDLVALHISSLLASSRTAAAALPKLIKAAETSLDIAEKEFAEGTFAPFWDAVEEAANTLARISATIDQLISNSTQYKTEGLRLETPAPPFELGTRPLPDASHTANRMRAIVRRAQKDFHFATIYEQRKTNRILVAGFSSLGQAINELGDSLTTSMERLAQTVATEFQLTRDQAAQDSEARREHERQECEMLDNIQRRRKPKL